MKMNNSASDSGRNETGKGGDIDANLNGSKLLNVVNLTDEQVLDSKEREAELKNYSENEISPGKRIVLHFSLAPADDPTALIDSNFEKDPVSFEYGDGNILPGFEAVMLGLKAGEKKSFTVGAEEAFGLRNEDNLQCYPRYQFPADLLLEKGLMISFSDAGGNEQAGVVSTFDVNNVYIDFNHPLAGLDILFTVEIKMVESI